VLYVWPILGLLTLGILFPLALLKLNQYLVRNSAYGTTKFTFHATFREYAQILLTMLGVVLTIGLLVWLTAISYSTLAPALLLVIAIAYFGLFVFFKATTTNLFYQRLALSDHDFKANLSINGLAKVILINATLIVLTLGLYLPAAKVRMTKYICSCLIMRSANSLDNFAAAEKENVTALGEEFSQAFDLST